MSNIEIDYSNSDKPVIDKDSVLYKGIYYRHMEIKGKRLYGRLNGAVKHLNPFKQVSNFFYRGDFEVDKNEDITDKVSIDVCLSDELNDELQKPRGGIVANRNYAKATQFDELKLEPDKYSLIMSVNEIPNRDDIYSADFIGVYDSSIINDDNDEQYEYIGTTNDDYLTVFFESTKLNEQFARFNITPIINLGGCAFFEDNSNVLPTVYLKINTQNKYGTFFANESSEFTSAGRGVGTIKILNESGDVLNTFNLNNDNFYVSGYQNYTTGINVLINGELVAEYDQNKRNYQVQYDIEYWHRNAELTIESISTN